MTNGKGSRRRPMNRARFEYNYDRAYGRRERKERIRDLAALQSTIYVRLKNKGAQRHAELVSFTDASRGDVTTSLQGLRVKGSVVYDTSTCTWSLTK